MKMKFNQKTKESVWKLVIRSIPFFSAGPELYDVMRNFRNSQTAFDQQVAEAVNALQNTSALITALQQGVTDRMEKLEELRKEHEKYSELAQIEAKKAEALLKQVEYTLGKDQAKERWIALTMHLTFGLIFFALGVLASERFKAWCEGLWSWLSH